eukprot:m.95224 g.95224  ORF g.95224 m.95224 type:complete len:64 (+) comp13048_c2_seq1:196-387(+)
MAILAAIITVLPQSQPQPTLSSFQTGRHYPFICVSSSDPTINQTNFCPEYGLACCISTRSLKL